MIEWDDKYLVGDLFIDSEHQILVKLINKIIQRKGSMEKEELFKYIRLLFDYVRFHFEHEESILTDLKWEGLDHHKKIHRAIVDDMKSMLKHADDINVLQAKLSPFLSRWIMEHIAQEDFHYKAHLVKTKGFITLNDLK